MDCSPPCGHHADYLVTSPLDGACNQKDEVFRQGISDLLGGACCNESWVGKHILLTAGDDLMVILLVDLELSQETATCSYPCDQWAGKEMLQGDRSPSGGNTGYH